MKPFELISRLTRPEAASEAPQLLSEFAYEFGWRLSETLDGMAAKVVGTNHLVVEHGLENSAVLTFIPADRAVDLDPDEQRALLALSYNNLIDWHIWIQPSQVRYVCNRLQQVPEFLRSALGPDDYSALRRDRFEEAIGAAPNPNLLALDDALIDSISRWQRTLAADLRDQVSREDLSTLFNAILLTRALEDTLEDPTMVATSNALVDSLTSRTKSLDRVIRSTIKRFTRRLPSDLLDWDRLKAFDGVDEFTVRSLLEDFYHHRGVPYRYDFSVMSKHALSRIYERYVTLFRTEPASPQLSFFPVALSAEEREKAYGSVYTPQFIASFFARYLREHVTPSAFKRAKVADFACGSGIFLRTVLELQIQSLGGIREPRMLDYIVRNMIAVDAAGNAAAAAKLSLAVLYLVAAGGFPSKLNVTTDDVIHYFERDPSLADSLDAFIVNPPFVRSELLSADARTRIQKFLGRLSFRKPDAYLVFLYAGIRALKPGGFGMFVLPQTFLSSENASRIRAWVSEETEIRCLVDLSQIPVFEQVGSYVVLLIVQKKAPHVTDHSAAMVRCSGRAGDALQDLLDGKRPETESYSIFNVDQDRFSRAIWSTGSPSELRIEDRLRSLPTLGEVFAVGQGVLTGADDVFMTKDVPKGEEAAYRPFMPDKLMTAYSLPSRTGVSMFYPFDGDVRFSEETIRKRFPVTWKRLESRRSELARRSGAKAENWWELHRPRKPSELIVPKIVGPHLMLLPRFGLDVTGKWIVSHSPYVRLRAESGGLDSLKYALAILNSSISAWFFSRNARKYRASYNLMEVTTVRALPLPDPSLVPAEQLAAVVDRVDQLMALPATQSGRELRMELDRLIADTYSLSGPERMAVLGHD